MTLQTFQINNRRFLGSKTKLLPFIRKVITTQAGEFHSFLDLFAGTGAVGNEFNDRSIKVITNDILYSSHVCLQTFFKVTHINEKKIKKALIEFNTLRPNGDNYISKTYGGKYFSKENAKIISLARERITKGSFSEDEKSILLTSLIYAADKVANTVGHYDAFFRSIQNTKKVAFKFPVIQYSSNLKNKVYRKDANQLVREISADVVYIDPPYNSRQYGSSYHVLENLVIWKKAEVYGVSKKVILPELRSKYSLKEAPEAFDDLIKNISAKHIFISYNDTEQRKHSRSNARISKQKIISTLKKRGLVKVFEKDFREFTTGKRSAINQKELLYYCHVNR